MTVKMFTGSLSDRMGKPTIYIGENKGADQLRSKCKADQRLCFCYTDSTIPLLLKSEFSSFKPSSVTVQPGSCQTGWEPKLLVFSCTSSIVNPNRFNALFCPYQLSHTMIETSP